MSGGAGFHVVDYSARTGTIALTADNAANDGAPGEGDNVRKDVERGLAP